jgi:mono/diheme cytochrome c family protein
VRGTYTHRLRAACGLALFAMALVGCDERHNMEEDAHLKPFEGIAFQPNGSSAFAPIDGTIARGQLNEDDAYFRGRQGNQLVQEMPVEIDADLLTKGQERYNIYCSVCHGLSGYGDGMVVQRGFSKPPSFHEDRLVAAPDGHLFDVISNGYGKMPPYAAQVHVKDRWAIVAYVRALQLSQRARPEDVPPASTQPADPHADSHGAHGTDTGSERGGGH